MKKLLMILLLLLFSLVMPVIVQGTEGIPVNRIGVLEGIFRPQSLLISGKNVIVAQESTFHVFRLRDAAPVRTFCCEGEGPGELKSVPMIPTTIQRAGRVLVAEGMNKVILYSLDRLQLMMEQRKGGMMWNFVPLGTGYLATRFQPRGGDRIDVTLVRMDRELRQTRPLHVQQTVDRDKEIIMLRDPIGFAILEDRLYVEKSNLGFVIDVYDRRGERLSRIEKKDFSPPPLEDAFKQALLESLKNDALIKSIIKARGGWDAFRKESTLTFPDHLPVIRAIRAGNGCLNILIHTGRYTEAELLVMNSDGEIVTRSRVPYTPSPYFTANAIGKSIELWDMGPDGYYFLLPDEEGDEWRLCRRGPIGEQS